MAQATDRRVGKLDRNIMRKYVVGFAFSENRETILLIEKKRPEWQKGLHNGIGGHIEDKEDSLAAMYRECKEETGLVLGWIRKGVMEGMNNDGNKFQCHIFYAYSDNIFNFKQIEDEKLGLHDPFLIPQMLVVTNLNFLIPYGMYDDGSNFISLTY